MLANLLPTFIVPEMMSKIISTLRPSRKSANAVVLCVCVQRFLLFRCSRPSGHDFLCAWREFQELPKIATPFPFGVGEKQYLGYADRGCINLWRNEWWKGVCLVVFPLGCCVGVFKFALVSKPIHFCKIKTTYRTEIPKIWLQEIKEYIHLQLISSMKEKIRSITLMK